MTGDLLPFWGWLLVLAFILVLGSFEYAIRSKKRIADLERLPRGDTLSATATVTDPPRPVPDWTIRELFYYLAPSLRTEQFDNTCEQVGQSVLDKFSIGQLKAWGRRVDNPTLVPIDSGYWLHAQFTYLFLGKDENSSEVWATKIRDGHQYMGLPEYRHLAVNKNEALGVWPNPIEQFISLVEAARRAYETLNDQESLLTEMAEHVGQQRHRRPGISREDGILNFLAGAIARRIPIYGKRVPSRTITEIDTAEFNRGNVCDGGKAFKYHLQDDRIYIELEVREFEVPGAIEKMKSVVL
jgi:hypothetical protein